MHTLGIWNTALPNGLAVPDASMHCVRSTDDVLELMNIGLMNRAVGATALNEKSSRSHRFKDIFNFFLFKCIYLHCIAKLKHCLVFFFAVFFLFMYAVLMSRLTPSCVVVCIWLILLEVRGSIGLK